MSVVSVDFSPHRVFKSRLCNRSVMHGIEPLSFSEATMTSNQSLRIRLLSLVKHYDLPSECIETDQIFSQYLPLWARSVSRSSFYTISPRSTLHHHKPRDAEETIHRYRDPSTDASSPSHTRLHPPKLQQIAPLETSLQKAEDYLTEFIAPCPKPLTHEGQIYLLNITPQST